MPDQDILQKVLIGGPTGVGKTMLALDFIDYCGPGRTRGSLLSFDSEGGQDRFHTTDPRLHNSSEGIYHFDRLVAPDIMAARLVIAKLADPQTPSAQLLIDTDTPGRKVTVPQKVIEGWGEDVHQVLRLIHEGKTYDALLFDTATRLGQDIADTTFSRREKEMGAETAAKLSMPGWGFVRREFANVLYSAIGLQVHVLATSWSKPRFDIQKKRSIEGDEVLDLLRGADKLFADIMMLSPHSDGRGNVDPATAYPPDALLLKVRSGKKSPLKKGFVLRSFDWQKWFATEPELSLPDEVEEEEEVQQPQQEET